MRLNLEYIKGEREEIFFLFFHITNRESIDEYFGIELNKKNEIFQDDIIVYILTFKIQVFHQNRKNVSDTNIQRLCDTNSPVNFPFIIYNLSLWH